MTPTCVLDLEVYTNFTLVVLKDVETEAVVSMELPLDAFDLEVLHTIVTTNRIITFNGTSYDIPLLHLILRGENSAKIKEASDWVIVQGGTWWNFEKRYNVKLNEGEIDHVDLMPVAPLTGSLKLYAARLHCRSIQDLPIAPSALITEEQKPILREYCENDCDNTIALFNALKGQLALRDTMSATYGIDLRSKSDAQIAEAVIKKEVETRLKTRLEKPGSGAGGELYYQPPAWMGFQSLDILERVREAGFIVGDKGTVIAPPELAGKKIRIGSGMYRLGIGGLHSSEKCQVIRADSRYLVKDIDVVSYYPAILINQGLYPRHIGKEFLAVYKTLVAKRLAAKAAGRKAENESLKITINGTFGKTASPYSVLYAPEVFMQIVITGQLATLMLIERLSDVIGVEVVSANTDGVTIRCLRECEADALAAVKDWETLTGFETERADYDGLYSRDVNNYVALKTDGEVKTKGGYGTGLPLHKNPYAQICSQAVIDYLAFDASIPGTIEACQDIRKFVCVRSVKGGATHHGVDIGRIVRWYYSTVEEEALLYKTNNYLVPNTLHAMPCVVLPEGIPDDLDRAWYVKEAHTMLEDLGVLS